MGHPVELFLDDIPEEFKCSICQDVLEEVTMTNPCEHAFCATCIQQWFHTNPHQCPIDRQHVINLKNPQRLYMNLLHRLSLHCRFGCSAVIQLGDYDHHYVRCKLNPENRKVCAQGCGAIVMLYEIKNHNCVASLNEGLQNLETTLGYERNQMLGLHSDIAELKSQFSKFKVEFENLQKQIGFGKAESTHQTQAMGNKNTTIKDLKAKLNTKRKGVEDTKLEVLEGQLLVKKINTNQANLQKNDLTRVEFVRHRAGSPESSLSLKRKRLAAACPLAKREKRDMEEGQEQRTPGPDSESPDQTLARKEAEEDASPSPSRLNSTTRRRRTRPGPDQLVQKIECRNARNVSNEVCDAIIRIFALAAAPYFNNSDQEVWKSLAHKSGLTIRYGMEDKIQMQLDEKWAGPWKVGLIFDSSTPHFTARFMAAGSSIQLTLGNLTFGIYK